MTDSSDGGNIYAAPKSVIAPLSQESFLSTFRARFWLACIIFGIALPWSVFGLMELGNEILLLASIFIFFWLLPVAWIFLPEAKSFGLKRLAISRLTLVSFGFTVATLAIALVSFLAISTAHYIFERLRLGT
jgi:hypothetical protein